MRSTKKIVTIVFCFLQQDDKYPKTLADSYYQIDQYKYNIKIIQRATGKAATSNDAFDDEFDTGHSFLSAGTTPTDWKRNGNGKNGGNGKEQQTGNRETGSTNPNGDG